MLDTRELSNKLLPIGSVVKLVDRESKIMISGRQQIDLETGDGFDYIGCEYPGGFDGENAILFDAESIIMIYFIGYQDVTEIHQRLLVIDSMNSEDE